MMSRMKGHFKVRAYSSDSRLEHFGNGADLVSQTSAHGSQTSSSMQVKASIRFSSEINVTGKRKEPCQLNRASS